MDKSVIPQCLMPEALSTSELIHLVQQKMPNCPEDINCLDRQELIELADRLSCFPKPQRLPRDNRRGAVIKLQYEKEEAKRGTTNGEVKKRTASSQKRVVGEDSGSGGNKRLKLALAERSDVKAFVQTKKIQIRKSSDQHDSSVVATGNASANQSTSSESNEKMEQGESEQGHEPESKRSKHARIAFP